MALCSRRSRRSASEPLRTSPTAASTVLAGAQLRAPDGNATLRLTIYPDTMARSRSSIRRGVLGAIFSPILGILAYSVLYLLACCIVDILTQSISKLPVALFYSPIVAMMGPLPAYIGFVLIGLPAWLILRRLDAESGFAYVGTGVLGGLLFPSLDDGWTILGEPGVIHNAIAGGLIMLFFWRIVRAGVGVALPSQDAMPPESVA